MKTRTISQQLCLFRKHTYTVNKSTTTTDTIEDDIKDTILNQLVYHIQHKVSSTTKILSSLLSQQQQQQSNYFMTSFGCLLLLLLLLLFTFHGIGRATFECTLRAIFAEYYPLFIDSPAAYANIVLQNGLAGTIGYFLSISLSSCTSSSSSSSSNNNYSNSSRNSTTTYNNDDNNNITLKTTNAEILLECTKHASYFEWLIVLCSIFARYVFRKASKHH
jgi:hypothetical protein